MIQRIQSVYLLLVFIFSLLAMFLTVGTLRIVDPQLATGIPAGEIVIKLTGVVFPEGLSNLPENSILGVVALIIAFVAMGISGFAIMQYKKRSFQLQLAKLIVLFLVGQVLTIFYFVEHFKNFFVAYELTYGLGVFLPLISMILTLLAIKAIRRDELLVKSAERIR